MDPLTLTSTVLALLTFLLALASYRLFNALRHERARADELRTSAEAQRCDMGVLRGAADAQRSQLEEERRRCSSLEQTLHDARAEGAQRLEHVRQEAASGLARANAAVTEAAARSAAQAEQIAGLEHRISELNQVRIEFQRTTAALAEVREHRSKLETQLAEERRSFSERLKLQDDLHGQLEEKFKGLAAQALERNTEKFESNTKLRLDEMGEALRRHVKELREKVEQTHQTDSNDRVALRTELLRMVEASRRIDQDAVNLTRALTSDSRAQGAWGELVLERILEQCGLREGVEYERQVTVSDDDGKRLRPDVVVHLPGARSVVVDAKVSLTAYNESVAATDDAELENALDRHLSSVRMHIKTLSEKGYWQANALAGGDYVLMFVAIESALAQALRSDPGLFEEAFRHHVILTSPSTLLATLRTIEHTWRVERQNETARIIVDEAGKLYDKFEGFVADLQDVGSRLKQAQSAYDGAIGKLSTGRGNLVGRVEKLRGLGLKVKKELPKELVESAVAEMLADASSGDTSNAADRALASR